MLEVPVYFKSKRERCEHRADKEADEAENKREGIVVEKSHTW